MSVPDSQPSLHGDSDHNVVATRPIRATRNPSNPSLNGSTTQDGSKSSANYLSNTSMAQSAVPDVRNGAYVNKAVTLLRPTSPTEQGSQNSVNTGDGMHSSWTSTPSTPQITVASESEQTTPRAEDNGTKLWRPAKTPATKTNSKDTKIDQVSTDRFRGIALDLPAGALGDDLNTRNIKFSNRGSMFISGQKVGPVTTTSSTAIQRPMLSTQRTPTSSSVPERMPHRIMSTDEEMLSEKVRLNYVLGSDTAAAEADSPSDTANKMGNRWQNGLSAETESMLTTSRAASSLDLTLPPSPAIGSTKSDNIVREEMELAGGLEDWQDVDSADVDRYGFIVPKSPTSSTAASSGVQRSGTVSGQGLQRVSTSLQVAAETPRRKHTVRRSPGSVKGEKRSVSDGLTRTTSNISVSRPSSSKSTSSHRYGTLRAASNRLPGNKDRRVMDEAGDMFTLPHSLTAGTLSRTTTVESDPSVKVKAGLDTKATSAVSRKKESEREEKWRKMARPVPSTTNHAEHKGIGGGMLFSFPPVTDAKLISRTWKGIPDTWRAPAWHYFLSVSARKNPRSLADDKLIKLFYEYQDINCPDDVQIDIDVPRTISSHIMFRRRYRGGQRLLFRVLHALSLHWPETGYVQGMAALAATLLSYYEEEKAFIMLVRLWECRGLAKLYKEGFGGLMEALDDFERGWLGEGEVAKKLSDLNIFPTAYGTRWYLTLFNYSIPFPAQLRVWDVFMLLGDNEVTTTPATSTLTPPPPPPPPQQQQQQQQQTSSTSNATTTTTTATKSPEDEPFGTTLDILHATSAALIDGMRDILLESDFENTMKVLTSWIPIRDEDLLMRVARAEWKLHRKAKMKQK